MRLRGYTFVAVGLLLSSSARAEVAPGSLDVHWSEGAEDCAATRPPLLQVHRYNDRTILLREGLCATFEAPVLYLLVGSKRALLIDTGAVAGPEEMPLGSTVMGLLPGEGPSKLPLLVLHTHGHLDHRTGDAQLDHLPSVEVVGTDLDSVRKYFGFSDWPNGLAQVDLGDRTLDVMPTPGHHPSHVSYYDRETGLFFSGDFFLPGRLILDDAQVDLASARRVADFLKDRPVTAVLGAHIELDVDGNMYPLGAQYHPRERPLALTKEDLSTLPAMVSSYNGFYTRRGIFVLVSQTRVLMAAAAGVAVILGAIGMGVRWALRRRKRTRLARGSVQA